ncbi:MAG: tRNA (adenosine(37)-N6)-threonylcarbamoyltransferase complex dimerization subunit type 1 TsaB [Nitrospira sp.]|nr:tRNA (adenosine(37)-N6)-threonylcarbamoyltransferase complex dimerization subunit type 1 TsaB [Candidatus Manganitrophaceae bacterium]HIL35808.1 tRNA (adenosine(37)-N6)-threonylcarbamoyltransferase complex dimerization subunit type 1 TsaB [Candidatus Manganitrophaceae bacterium]
MKILAIETSTLAGGAALMNEAGLISVCHLEPEARHSEQLLTAIDRLLKESKILLSDLDGIAVSIGPGSFTGLRIGLATAKGLAMGTDIPMVLVPTMEVIAAAFPEAKGLTVPILDARREEVYWSLFDYRQQNLIRHRPDQVTTVRKALEEIDRFLLESADPATDEILFAGDGAVKYQKYIVETIGPRARFPSQDPLFPSAKQVAERGLLLLEKGEVCSHEQAVPLYMRAPQAELKWKAGRGKIRSS